MKYPLVLELADSRRENPIPVSVTLRVLNLHRRLYYAWLKNPVTDSEYEEAYLINAAFDVHQQEPTFGYRLIADEVNNAGFKTSDRRMWRLCSRQGIHSSTAKKKPRYRTAGAPVHDDLLQRNFTATALDQVWAIDITEHRTQEGKLYLCAIKDLYSRKIVGYSISPRMKSSIAVNALRNAVQQRKPVNTIVHSDRGSQFRSKKFCRALELYGLRGSMGRVGACADNAAIESFFALLQKNVLDQKKIWRTRQELKVEMVYWIEAKYHRKRRQQKLGKLTPIEFESLHHHQQTA